MTLKDATTKFLQTSGTTLPATHRRMLEEPECSQTPPSEPQVCKDQHFNHSATDTASHAHKHHCQNRKSLNSNISTMKIIK